MDKGVSSATTSSSASSKSVWIEPARGRGIHARWFPRTVAQAEALDEIASDRPIDMVIDLVRRPRGRHQADLASAGVPRLRDDYTATGMRALSMDLRCLAVTCCSDEDDTRRPSTAVSTSTRCGGAAGRVRLRCRSGWPSSTGLAPPTRCSIASQAPSALPASSRSDALTLANRGRFAWSFRRTGLALMVLTLAPTPVTEIPAGSSPALRERGRPGIRRGSPCATTGSIAYRGWCVTVSRCPAQGRRDRAEATISTVAECPCSAVELDNWFTRSWRSSAARCACYPSASCRGQGASGADPLPTTSLGSHHDTVQMRPK